MHYPSRKPVYFILTILLLMLTLSTCGALAQTPLTPEQQELIRVQITKEKALTTYYYGQLELSRKQAAASKPQTYTNIWDKYSHKDPGDLVESVAAILGVILILVMFISTVRTARRDQHDVRFYEALKRFGDADSPALRSTAAGLLAQMGAQRAYFDTALDQLISGLALEENPVVRASIRNAILGLTRDDPQAIHSRVVDPDMRQKVNAALGDPKPKV